jgi:hypothetical protein
VESLVRIVGMGLALDRGRHRLRMEYARPAFRLGTMVSALAWAAWIAAAVLVWRRKKGLAGA